MAILAALLAVGAARADDLAVARAALADGLPAIAERQLLRQIERRRDQPRDCVEPLLMLCRTLAEQGRHDELLAALDALPAVEALGADRGGFAFWRAAALLGAGRAGEARACVARAAGADAAPEFAAGLLRVEARACLALGEKAAALATYARLQESVTNPVAQAENLLEWARAQRAAGDVAAADALLQRQAQLEVVHDAMEEGRLLRGQLLRQLARTAEAETALTAFADDARVAAPRRAAAWLELAEIAADGGRTNALRAAGQQALALAAAPRDIWASGLRYGRALIRTPALLGEGADVLKRALREFPADPASAAAQRALADAALAAGQNARAAAEYQIYLETYDEPEVRAATLAGRAWALLRLGAFDQAADAFLKAGAATADAGQRAEYRFKAADAMHADGRFARAAEAYDTLVAELPQSPLAPRARFMAADARERLGELDAAAASFGALADDFAGQDLGDESLLRLATLHERRDDAGQAIAGFTRLFDRSTNALWRGQALIGRGRVQVRGYRFDAAIADFERALRDFPGVAEEAAYLIAMALYGAGRDADAWRACEQFVERYPDSALLPEARLWMAKFRYNRQEYDQAQPLLLLVAERWPDASWADAARLWAGRCAFRRTEFQEAVEILSRVARDHPDSPWLAEARFVQAEALCELARFEEAVLVLDEIIARFPQSEWVTAAWGRKGDALFSLGVDDAARYNEAINAYTVAAARPDADTEVAMQAEFKIGRCLEKLQRPREAIDQYYGRVVVRFLRERAAGVWQSANAQTWFARAALQAAELLEKEGEFEQAARVLQRVEQTDVPGREEARARIARLQAEHRWNW